MNHVPYSVDVPDTSVQRPEVPSSVAIQGKTGSRGSSLGNPFIRNWISKKIKPFNVILDKIRELVLMNLYQCG